MDNQFTDLLNGKICITPFVEIRGLGQESIYDFIDKEQVIDPEVIAYLQTTKPFMMSPGIYEHPFKPGTNLFGPYWYTDDTYVWDRDTWKYVVKYGLKLPDYFIEHVHSQKGKEFLEDFYNDKTSWKMTLKEWKKEKKFNLDLLSNDAYDTPLADF